MSVVIMQPQTLIIHLALKVSLPFVYVYVLVLVSELLIKAPDVPALVVLYGKISRIRAISSPKVLAAAEQVLRRIADIYFEPPIVLSRDQIRSMLRDGSVDILRDFSQTCRAEFEMLRSQQLSSGVKALLRVG